MDVFFTTFDIKPGDHPIVPIMLYDSVLAAKFADALLQEGIYVIGFFFPVALLALKLEDH